MFTGAREVVDPPAGNGLLASSNDLVLWMATTGWAVRDKEGSSFWWSEGKILMQREDLKPMPVSDLCDMVMPLKNEVFCD